MNNDDSNWWYCLILIPILWFLFPFFIGTSDKLVNETLQPLGYENIQTHGYGFLKCADDDFYSTKFTAMLNQREIQGAVCCGLFFKNCTIRYS